MKLTPFAKVFIAIVVLAVVGFATWHYKGDSIKEWAGGSDKPASGGDSSASTLKYILSTSQCRNAGGPYPSEVIASDIVRHQSLPPRVVPHGWSLMGPVPDG